MPEQTTPLGTLFIASEVLQHEAWQRNQAISAAITQISKYRPLDGLLIPSSVRSGDYALLLANLKADPKIVSFIGIPGRSRAPIVQELYVAS